jgi:MFS family permease
MYGSFLPYVGSLIWLAFWSLIGEYAYNQLMLIFYRALQGLGPAAFLLSGLMLIGSIYRPGPQKNLVFSIYGAAAPLGLFIDIFFSRLSG